MRAMLKITIKTFKEVFKVMPFYTSFFFLTAVLAAVLSAVGTFVTSSVFDKVYTSFNTGITNELYKYIWIFLFIYIAGLMVNTASGFIISNGFYQKGTNKFKIRLGEHCAKLNIIDFEKTEMLNLLQRAKQSVDGHKITNIVFNIRMITQGALSLIGVSAVLASFNAWLVPIAVLGCLPTLAVKIIRGEKFYALRKKQIPKMRTLNYLWSLFLSPAHIKEMRVLGFADYFSDRWEKLNLDVAEENWQFQKKDALFMFLFDFFKVFCYVLGIMASIYLVYKGYISPGQFGACLTAFASMQNSTFTIVRQLSGFTGNCPFVNDYFMFLGMEPEKWGTNQYKGINDKIEINKVNFKYPNTDENVLKNINLTIKKHEKIAIIGENGSGKTTLSKIILGLYPPNSGLVLYDGTDLRNYSAESFYGSVSIVSQNFTKYYLTLRENVGISDVALMNDDARIHEAVARAEIDEVYSKAGGMDNIMGCEFGGAELSGGQWQKLAISRGLFRDYDFIVLDEPTSALDPIVETEIFSKFLEATKNKTALIISHRVGFCRLADKIVVMRGGEICETGSHKELMSKKGHYFDLFTSQQAWYV